MGRIGKQFIPVPEKVQVKIDGQKIVVDGPKGSLSRILPSLVCCTLDEGSQKLFLEKVQDTKLSRALYGLSRTLVANMVHGVSLGFQKRLEITGVGYRAQMAGKDLVLNMGYSHPVKMVPPQQISIKVESPCFWRLGRLLGRQTQGQGAEAHHFGRLGRALFAQAGSYRVGELGRLLGSEAEEDHLG